MSKAAHAGMLRFAAFELDILELEARTFKPSAQSLLLQHSVAQ